MANSEGNQENLISYEKKWFCQPTHTIRVPVSLTHNILDFAHQLDDSLSQAESGKCSFSGDTVSGDFEGLEDDIPY